MGITGADVFKFALKLIDVIFTREELKVGSVEPSGRGKYTALDSERIALLKSNIFFYFLSFKLNFLKIFSCDKAQIQKH